MIDDIAAVQASALSLVSSFDASDFRVALVDYRDFPILPFGGVGDYPFRDVLAFSADPAAIASAIQSLTIGDGGDLPESVYSALIHAIDATTLGGWRAGVRRFVILLGDAPPHDPEPITGYTLASVLSAAAGAGGAPLAAPLGSGGAASPSASSPESVFLYTVAIGAPIQQFTALAEGTNGSAFVAPSASDVVDSIVAALQGVIGSPASAPSFDEFKTMRTLAKGLARYEARWLKCRRRCETKARRGEMEFHDCESSFSEPMASCLLRAERKLPTKVANACRSDAPECYQGGCSVEVAAALADTASRLPLLTSALYCDGLADDDSTAAGATRCTNTLLREVAKLTVKLTKCYDTCNLKVLAGTLPAAACSAPLSESADPAAAACFHKVTTRSRVAIDEACFRSFVAPACYDDSVSRPGTASGWIDLISKGVGRRIGDLTGTTDAGATAFCASPSGAFLD